MKWDGEENWTGRELHETVESVAIAVVIGLLLVGLVVLWLHLGWTP